LLILMILTVSALAYTLVTALGPTTRAQARDRITVEALAQARAALLAWAVSHVDIAPPANARPGELPCPDTDNDGLAQGNCAAGQLGRLPWKTLGLAPLHDGHGELLWYAPGIGFRSAAQDAGGLNSDRAAAMLLRDSTGALLTPAGAELAAVLIAPGAALPGQGARPSNLVADYMEAALGTDNRVAGASFITGPVRDAAGEVVLNDIVVGVSGRELINMAERRVLAEAQRALDLFSLANGGKLPNAAAPADAACLAGVNNVLATLACPAQAGRCIGRLAEDSLAPHAAPWFNANGWGRAMTYAVRDDTAIDASGADCSAGLSLDGAATRMVLVAGGSARAGQIRPSAVLSNYLEDAANQDAWTPAFGQANFAAPAAGNDLVRSRP
jgi:hypothetical protein